ncbi:MAG TPA: amidohydrolase family protein [Gemmataceae bacterium]|nr:amidohydrolase family protein [Gemmataceae bacterium]
MRFSFVLFLIALLSVPIPALSQQVSPPKALVLTGVTVIDATGTPAQADMTLVIEGGRIRAVGRTAGITVPDGARVVNAAGKFLIPGLWDMHVHWYDEPSLPLFTANGVTGIRLMCGFPRHLSWRKRFAGGELLGPRLVLAGPIVDGPDPVWPDSLRAADANEGREAVRAIKTQGYDCVKVYNLLPRSAYFGIADKTKKLRFPLVGHVPFAVTAAEASDAGQKTIEHLSAVSLACSSREEELRRGLNRLAQEHGEPGGTGALLRLEVQAADSYDAAKAEALFARLIRNGTWDVPTLAVRQAHARLANRSMVADAWSRYVPSSLKNRWDNRRAATYKNLGAQDLANFKRSFPQQLELVREMHRAGVRLLAGTDTGALDCLAGFALHDELQLLVRAGLTPMEALQSATSNPARCLNRLDELGTVERGKLADLVLLDANPLDDIRNTTKIHAVIANGRLLTQADLRHLLTEVEAAARRNSAPDTPPGAHAKYP